MAELRDTLATAMAKRSESWRRIRVGLAGLGGMLLLLALASAMFDRLALEEQITSQSQPKSPSNGVEQPSEPMAELGVAPGAATEPVVPNK
jgi:hypothetical protein